MYYTGLLCHPNVTLLFLSDCGILQFTVSPKSEQISFAHSVVMHYHCFTIVVAPFYLGLMFILSYYLLYVFSLYSIVLTTLHISIVIALVCVYLHMLLLI